MTRSRLALAAVLLACRSSRSPQVEVTAAAQAAGDRRSVVPRPAALALGRPVARRPRGGGERRSGQQVHVLSGHHRRRGLEDRGRRAQLGQRVRRLLQGGVGRRHRRRAVEPERRLRRDGRGLHPGQRVPWRRHLQVDRCRQDLDAHGPRGHQADRTPGRASHQSRHRVGRRSRRPVGAEPRSRRLQDARRRTHLAEGALQGRERRRHRSRAGPGESQRPLRVDSGIAPLSVGLQERRSRHRPLQVHRRR